MSNLLLIFAEIMSEKEIVDQIAESAERYKLNPCEETLTKVQMVAGLLLAKNAINKSSLEETIASFNETERFKNMFKSQS